MTVHAAKGLEFPVVCVADLGRQPNYSTPDLLVDGDRIGLRLLGLDGEEPVKALDYEELSRERREREGEEEDRILYVAMTRARERLLLSGSLDVGRWPRPNGTCPPMSWLAPALCAELPALASTATEPVHDLDVRGGEATVRCVVSTPAHAEELLGLAPGAGRAAACSRGPARGPGIGAARRCGGVARAAGGSRPGASRARSAGGARRGSGERQLHLAERAGAMRLPLLPRTRPRAPRGALARGALIRGGPRCAREGDARAPPARARRLQARCPAGRG